MTRPQPQNKPAPDVTAQGIHGGTRTDDPHKGGGKGGQSPDRSPEDARSVENAKGRRRMLASVSPKWQKLFERAWAGSRKAAIRSHCLRCCGFSPQEVTLCSDSTCSLFEFRRKG